MTCRITEVELAQNIANIICTSYSDLIIYINTFIHVKQIHTAAASFTHKVQ